MDDAFRKYMSTQIHKIDVDKWNEGVRLDHKDGNWKNNKEPFTNIDVWKFK